jgi:predicted nucleic acid-binding protein
MSYYIFDSSSLIYLTKIQVKELLPNLGLINISPIVKIELINSPDKYPDAKILNQNVEHKIIHEIKEDKIRLPLNENLGSGELETIELSIKRNGIPVIDDKQAFNYARGRGLKPITSEIILISLVQQGVISKPEFEIKLNKLASIKSLKLDVVAFLKQIGLGTKNTKKSSK